MEVKNLNGKKKVSKIFIDELENKDKKKEVKNLNEK